MDAGSATRRFAPPDTDIGASRNRRRSRTYLNQGQSHRAFPESPRIARNPSGPRGKLCSWRPMGGLGDAIAAWRLKLTSGVGARACCRETLTPWKSARPMNIDTIPCPLLNTHYNMSVASLRANYAFRDHLHKVELDQRQHRACCRNSAKKSSSSSTTCKTSTYKLTTTAYRAYSNDTCVHNSNLTH